MSERAGFCLMLAVVLAIWWRNHDILSDLYDYSSIAAAAGKVEAGMKPYVDFRSTMQSSTYLLSRAAEIAFGRSYLGLTVGGLVLSLTGASVLFALWRRSFGAVGGLMLAAAIAWSGLSQHVVIFYNTVGILCLAVVATVVAQNPRLWRRPSWDLFLLGGALLLGGMNKINFQVLGLSLAAALVGLAWATDRLVRVEALRSLLLLGLGGLLVPLGLELAWTGATFAQWFENVVLLAGERVDSIGRLAALGVYLGPVHDHHHHIPFTRLTAAGLALLGVVAVLVWRRVEVGTSGHRRTAALIVYVAGAAVGGVLLTITNVETIALTSLALVVSAAALWEATQSRTEGRVPLSGWAWLVPVVALGWAVNGAFAAWHGSRVQFGRADTDRTVFVRLENAPPALRYFEGVRLDAALHESLLLVARELTKLQASRGNLRGVLFGPGFEWMERAYPDAIQPGMPIWFHVGTSLHENDGEWLTGVLRAQGVDRILTHPSWEAWPATFQVHLEKNYRYVAAGAVARLYEKKGTEVFAAAAGSFENTEPLAMIERTGSNLHLATSPVPAGFAFSTSPWGDFIGRKGPWVWEWSRGLAIVEGMLVAQRAGDLTAPGRFSVKFVATGAGAPDEVLWQADASVEAGRAWVRVPFRITPYGRPARLEVVPLDGEPQSWEIGCREIQVRQTIEQPGVPPPTNVEGGGETGRLSDGKFALLRSASSTDPHAWHTGPLAIWTPRSSGTTPWVATLETENIEGDEGTLPVVMLLWYRSGRVELLSQHALDRQKPGSISFEGGMPEPGGWLGVALRPMERGKAFNMKVRLKQIVY